MANTTPISNITTISYYDEWKSVSYYYTSPYLTAVILLLYAAIFIVGVIGNSLVLIIVAQYKSMQTVTNNYIACLSISDLLICIFAIPFTPLNALIYSWIFGDILCRMVPTIQTSSVFVSTLSSVVIAIDRYIVICHPHKPRMTKVYQKIIIIFIWIVSLSAAIPFCVYQKLVIRKGRKSCEEAWPSNHAATIYTGVLTALQLALPALIITICYSAVSYQLYQRTKKRKGMRDYKKEKAEIERNHRINRMLIAMIVIFILCWSPLNFFHYIQIPLDHQITAFFVAHLIAMSSVMYNPFLYGWLNENFNQHFKKLWKKLACTKTHPTPPKQKHASKHQHQNQEDVSLLVGNHCQKAKENHLETTSTELEISLTATHTSTPSVV